MAPLDVRGRAPGFGLALALRRGSARHFPLAALLVAGTGALSACGGQQKPAPEAVPTHPAAQASPRPSDPTQAKVDQATLDFQAEARALEGEMKASSGPDWGSIESRMKDLTRRHPDYGLAWYDLGVAQEKQNRLAEATASYQRALRTTPPIREAQENLAAMAARRGDSEEALGMLRDLVARDPGAAAARVALARTYLARGDMKQADRLAIQALTREPRSLGAYCVLTYVAVREKNFRRAKLLAAQGFKIEPDYPCLNHALGLVALVENETALALTSFERAAAKDPKLLDARFQIAQISMGYKDFNKAIANYSAVTEVDPRSAAGFLDLGVALKGAGRFPEAEKAYLKAIELAGEADLGEAHFNLGVLYLKNLNRPDDAMAQLKRYIQLSDPKGDDPSFAMIEEVEKLKQLREEEKRQQEEAEKQAAIDKRVQEEQEKKKAEQAKEEAAEKAHQEEIDRKAREAGEPVGPNEQGRPPDAGQATPPPSPPPPPSTPPRARPQRKKPAEPKEPPQEPRKPKDFE